MGVPEHPKGGSRHGEQRRSVALATTPLRPDKLHYHASEPDEPDRGVSGSGPGLEDNAAALVPVQDALALDLPELVQRAQDYARKSKSDRTWKAY